MIAANTIKFNNVHNLLSYIICFFLTWIQCTYPTTALGDSATHLKNLPNFLPIRTPYDNIEEIIKTYNFRSFDLDKPNKLYTNIYNTIDFINTINKVILFQDNLFIIKSNPYNIILVDNPNLSETTGVAEKGYIVIEGNFKENIKDYTRVISHELIHRYIGRVIEQDQESEVKHKWFFEGFTEFLGVKTLLDIKFINQDEYLEIVNTTLTRYFNSPIYDINFEKISEKHLLDQNISILSYDKGFILAMIIDEKVNQTSNRKYGLQDIINRIIDEITLKQTHFNVDLFINCLIHYLPKSLAEKFVDSINNSSVLLTLLPSRLLNKSLTFQDIDKYGDICFNLTRSLELQRIYEVESGSDCYNMELRDGQELKCYSIDFNSGNIKLKVLENKIQKIVHLKANKVTNSIPVYK